MNHPESCSCENCALKHNVESNRHKRKSKENREINSSDVDETLSQYPADENLIEEITTKKCKSLDGRSNLSLIPFISPSEKSVQSPGKSQIHFRSKRCLEKAPKKSISCEDFIEQYNDIVKSKSNINAYQISQSISNLILTSFPLDLNILGNSFVFDKDLTQSNPFISDSDQLHNHSKMSSVEIFFKLNLAGLRAVFNKIKSCGFDDALTRLNDRIKQIIERLLKTAIKCQTKNSVKVVRILVLIFESPTLSNLCDNPNGFKIFDALCMFIATLKPVFIDRLIDLFSSYSREPFFRIVDSLNKNIGLFTRRSPDFKEVNFEDIRWGLEVLNMFYCANSQSKIIKKKEFFNYSLSEMFMILYNVDNICIKNDILLKYPWLVDTETKQVLLSAENMFLQNLASNRSESELENERDLTFENRTQLYVQNLSERFAFDLLPSRVLSSHLRSSRNPEESLGTSRRRRIPLQLLSTTENLYNTQQRRNRQSLYDRDTWQSMYCYFIVCRDHISLDTFKFYEKYEKRGFRDLKKPLKIIFSRESGIDEGGLKNEYFQLLTRELFSPEYGMFEANEDSKLLWFSKNWSKESNEDFIFCGMMVGLALYNGVMLDLNLPKAFYKHLLDLPLSFSDMLQIDKSLGEGLKALLDFDGDVESVYCRNFETSYESFGETVNEELCANGSKILVNNANRGDFVKMYTNWYLCDSVSRQVKAFKKGFDMIIKSENQWVYRLFSWKDLSLTMCGIEYLDFVKWKENATLTGYKWTSSVIKNFWNIVMKFDAEDKRKLLHFVTGCVRAPIKGLGDLPLRIIKAENIDLLPTSRTCFNQLILPPYETKAKLKRNLMLALENSMGFGLQ